MPLVASLMAKVVTTTIRRMHKAARRDASSTQSVEGVEGSLTGDQLRHMILQGAASELVPPSSPRSPLRALEDRSSEDKRTREEEEQLTALGAKLLKANVVRAADCLFAARLQTLRDTTRRLVFGSGAYKAIGFVGALQTLCPTKASFYAMMRQVRVVEGISAGSIVAVMACVGVDPWTMEDYALSFDARMIARPPDLSRVLRRYGIMSPEGLVAALRALIARFCHDADITLKGLQDKTGRLLRIYACDTESYGLRIMDAESDPTMPLFRAMQFSCAIPGLFQAGRMNGAMLQDGGTLQHVSLVNGGEFSPQESLFFFVKAPHRRVEHALDYIVAQLTLQLEGVHAMLACMPSHMGRAIFVTHDRAEELDYK